MSEMAEISGRKWATTICCSRPGKAAQMARGKCRAGQGCEGPWPSCHVGLGTVRSPLASWELMVQMDTFPHAQPQFVMSGCTSPTAGGRPQRPHPECLNMEKACRCGRDSSEKMALRVLCDRFFFLLQPGEAICIHLISEVLVIGDINCIAKPDKYFTLSCSG